MKIGATYLRIAPNGDKTFVTLETQDEKEYYEGLAGEGYTYQEQHVYTPNTCEACSA